ncbi:hypothetical protein CBL_07246 [Carabus blaptoides fortunei]
MDEEFLKCSCTRYFTLVLHSRYIFHDRGAAYLRLVFTVWIFGSWGRYPRLAADRLASDLRETESNRLGPPSSQQASNTRCHLTSDSYWCMRAAPRSLNGPRSTLISPR